MPVPGEKGENIMEGIAILVNVGLLYTAYGLTIYSLILLVKALAIVL